MFVLEARDANVHKSVLQIHLTVFRKFEKGQTNANLLKRFKNMENIEHRWNTDGTHMENIWRKDGACARCSCKFA